MCHLLSGFQLETSGVCRDWMYKTPVATHQRVNPPTPAKVLKIEFMLRHWRQDPLSRQIWDFGLKNPVFRSGFMRKPEILVKRKKYLGSVAGSFGFNYLGDWVRMMGSGSLGNAVSPLLKKKKKKVRKTRSISLWTHTHLPTAMVTSDR